MSDSPGKCPACGAETKTVATRANGFDILVCGACDLRFATNTAGREHVEYDDLYRDDGAYANHLEEAVAARQQLVPLARARRVTLAELTRAGARTLLEVGCGVGVFLQHVERLGITCCGLDSTANAIAQARQIVKGPLHVGPLTAEVFPGQTFDVVCTWEVLEHIPQLDGFLPALIARLNPGGTLYLSTPNNDSRYMWRDIAADPRSRPPVHLTYWTRRALAAYLTRLGLADVQVRPYSIPASAALRSGHGLDRWWVYADAVLRPSQRRTLLGSGRRPA